MDGKLTRLAIWALCKNLWGFVVRLCYSVFVASTSEHISIRLPKHLAQQLREEATRVNRSIAWVIVDRLQLAAQVAQMPVDPLARPWQPEPDDPLPAKFTEGEPSGGTFAKGTRPVPATCPLCDGPLKPWGPGRRCEKCGRNW